jgi:hypothetical protein
MNLPDDAAQTYPDEHPKQVAYPYEDGDTIVLGPEIFALRDGSRLCWRGVPYVRQPECPSGVILDPGFHFVGTAGFNGGQSAS